MKLCVTLAGNGKVTGYATLGKIENGITLDLPDDTDLSVLTHAKWDGASLLELPAEPAAPTVSAQDRRLSALLLKQAQLTVQCQKLLGQITGGAES